MKIVIQECKHCGVEYHVQYSGSYDAIDTPREYRDGEYCPECKKAIVDVLKQIPVKFAYKNVETDEVDLNTLLRWEKERIDDHQQKIDNGEALLPLARRVFSGLRNIETGEHDIVNQVIGREDKIGRIYIYSYWSSDMSKQRILVNRRVELATGIVGKYKVI